MKKKHKILIPFLLIFAIIVGVLSLSIRPAYSGVNYDSASTQNTTDKTIKFNSDGKLKILHITDTHLKPNHNFDPTIWLVEKACDTEKPDIVMLTGDIVLNCESAEDTKKLINALMNVFQSRDIPVAVTFGNHDSEEGAMSREALMAYYNTFSCSVSVDDGEALSGCGTYSIPVLSSDGEKVKFNLWVFDSGDYDHTNAFGVKYKGIDIVNSLSTRYIGLFHSTQGGYRVIEIDENDTSTYETRVERIYDIFDSEAVKEEKQNGDEFTYKMAREFAVKGKIQKIATDLCREITEVITGRQVSYAD